MFSPSSQQTQKLINHLAGITAAQRVESPLHVEARGTLQPAVDFYTRAVDAAERQGKLTGNILASVRLFIVAGQKRERFHQMLCRYLKRHLLVTFCFSAKMLA